MRNPSFSPDRQYLLWLRWVALFLSALYLVYFCTHHLFNDWRYVIISILALSVVITYRPIRQYIEIKYDGRRFVFYITSSMVGSIALCWNSDGVCGKTRLGKLSQASKHLGFSTTIEGKVYQLDFFNPAGCRYLTLLPVENRSSLVFLANQMMF